MIGENRSTQTGTCPIFTLYTTDPLRIGLGSNPGLCGN